MAGSSAVAGHARISANDRGADRAGRIYRKISYGPLLDVFMLDMRSYRGPNAENLETSYGLLRLLPRPTAGRLAQAFRRPCDCRHAKAKIVECKG